jgi:hypothetical protein
MLAGRLRVGAVSRLLKKSVLDSFNVACPLPWKDTGRGFRCAPEIKRFSAHDFAGPSVAPALAGVLKEFFSGLLDGRTGCG